MSSKPNTYLAIEFATSSVKFIKMTQQDDIFQLLEAKTIPIGFNHDLQTREKLYQEIAHRLLSEENQKNNTIFISINSVHTCFSSFVLPKMRKKEIAETLRWKIKDEIPFPLEEAVLDYQSFDITVEAKLQCLALVAVTPKDAIDSHSKFLPKPKLKPYFYPAACFSIDYLGQSLLLPKEEIVVMIDIGYSITEIAIYSDQKLNFLRKIEFGNHSLIQAMMQPLTSEKGRVCLNFEEAEQAIRSENLLDQNSQVLLANKIELSRFYPLVRPEFEKLADEINRSLDYFIQQHGKSVSRIYLTGGLSRLKGLSDFLFQKLQTSIQILDLSKAVKVEQPLVQDLSLFYRPISLVLDRGTALTSKLEISLDQPIYSMNLNKALAILMSIWFLVICSSSWRYYEINRRQKVIVKEIENMKIGYEEAKKIGELQTQIQKGEMVKAKILAAEPNWNEVFMELSNVFPDDVLLKDIGFNQKVLTINGLFKTGDENAVSELLIALEGPIFKNVTLINVEKKESTTEFSLRTDVT